MIGETELFIILVFAFVLLGPDKLPEIARMLGVALKKVKETQEEVHEVVQREIIDPVDNLQKPTAQAKPVEKKPTSFAELKQLSEQQAKLEGSVQDLQVAGTSDQNLQTPQTDSVLEDVRRIALQELQQTNKPQQTDAVAVADARREPLQTELAHNGQTEASQVTLKNDSLMGVDDEAGFVIPAVLFHGDKKSAPIDSLTDEQLKKQAFDLYNLDITTFDLHESNNTQDTKGGSAVHMH